jgi:signal transduction histidine kinase
VALAVTTGVIISLPQRPWETVMPVVWLFPILLWLAARRPIFAAEGAFMVSLMIVLTTVSGTGHFGDPRLQMSDRVLQAQVVILVVAIFALVLAALFAERRANEARLIQSNTMLERERDNKLMNVQAITAAIAHEIRQPLSAIATNGGAALRFLAQQPPDHEEARAALQRIVRDSHRTSEVFDGLRALFRQADHQMQPIDVNKIMSGVLQSLRSEFEDHDVELRSDLSSELPLVDGHRSQLEEVILNLVRNAVEAMDATTDRSRLLRVITEPRADGALL